MPDRVLVTGGAGYIGSVVAAQLVSKGAHVVVFDNLCHGSRNAVPRGAELVLGDTADRALLDRVLLDHRIDAVMHFAAYIEAGESMKVPEKYFRNNAANSLTLLEAMIAHKIPRFVFSSTAALYGTPDRTPIEETDSLQPTNAYGASKLLVEQMLDWFHRIHGLRYASLRYFNAAGAAGEHGEDHHPESHLIPLTIQVALGERERIDIYGTDYPTPDGTCIRDYVHVIDIAESHVLALERISEVAGRVFNVGNSRGFSVREVVAAVERIVGRKIPVRESPRRPGDPAELVASSDRIRRDLGWSPRFSDLDRIIQTAWAWKQRFPKSYSPGLK
jgi:UDP-glucose 4-epimerase